MYNTQYWFTKNRATTFLVLLFFVSIFLLVSSHPVAASNTDSVSLDTDQFLHISDSSQSGLDVTGDLTIEAWIKLDSDPGSAEWIIASKHNTSGSPGRGYVFALGNNDQLTTYIAANNTSQTRKYVSWNPSTDVWYHVAMVYDASAGEADFYVNGVQQGSTQTGLPNSINNNNKNFAIGARNVSGSSGADYFVDGKIDEVRVWSSERSASEIASNMNVELSGSETNLEGYWKLNGNADDTTSNNNDLTEVQSPSYVSDTPFIQHHAAIFDGEKHLELSDNSQTGLDITGDLTIEAWIHMDEIPDSSSEMVIASKHNSGGAGNQKGYNFAIGEEDKLTLYISSDGSTHTKKQVGLGTLATSTWYHVAVAYDASAGEADFYLNGTQQGTTQTGLPTSIKNNTAPFDIGARGSGEDRFTGKIDDVRVWSTERTSSEISQNKDAELAGSESNLEGYWKLNGALTDATSNGNDFGFSFAID